MRCQLLLHHSRGTPEDETYLCSLKDRMWEDDSANGTPSFHTRRIRNHASYVLLYFSMLKFLPHVWSKFSSTCISQLLAILSWPWWVPSSCTCLPIKVPPALVTQIGSQGSQAYNNEGPHQTVLQLSAVLCHSSVQLTWLCYAIGVNPMLVRVVISI